MKLSLNLKNILNTLVEMNPTGLVTAISPKLLQFIAKTMPLINQPLLWLDSFKNFAAQNGLKISDDFALTVLNNLTQNLNQNSNIIAPFEESTTKEVGFKTSFKPKFKAASQILTTEETAPKTGAPSSTNVLAFMPLNTQALSQTQNNSKILTQKSHAQVITDPSQISEQTETNEPDTFFGKVMGYFTNIPQSLIKMFSGLGESVTGIIEDGGNILGGGLRILKGIFTLNKYEIAKGLTQIIAGVAKVVLSVAGAVLNVLGGALSIFGKKFSSDVHAAADKVRGLRNRIDEVVQIVNTAIDSVLHFGSELEAFEAQPKAGQTGPFGKPATFDLEKIQATTDKIELSVLAKDILEQNAPIIRQFKDDQYPMATLDLIANAEDKGSYYDLNDSFSHSSKESQAYTPTTYAYAEQLSSDELKELGYTENTVIRLVYERYYPASTMPSGVSTNMPSPEHENDNEKSILYYDLTTQSVVKVAVSKHGDGLSNKDDAVYYNTNEVEFKDGRPVINVALGSHASGVSSGLEKTEQELLTLLDNYPGSDAVKMGLAVELTFPKEAVVVLGSETDNDNKRVTFHEKELWVDSVDGDKKTSASQQTYYIEKSAS